VKQETKLYKKAFQLSVFTYLLFYSFRVLSLNLPALYADVVGTLGLIWFSVGEGREAFEKAKGRSYEYENVKLSNFARESNNEYLGLTRYRNKNQSKPMPLAKCTQVALLRPI